MKYGEGVSQPATPRSAKSASSTAGSASRQAGAAQRPFAVFDIDGTLIRWQLYHAIADALIKLGYVRPDSYNSMRRARMDWKRRAPGASFKAYEAELINVYEKALISLTKRQFETAAEAVFGEYKDQVYTYTRELIKELKRKNYLLFAISGSQVEIVKKIAKYYGFDDFVGSLYEYKKGRFTGAKKVGSHHKDKTLDLFIKTHRTGLKGSYGIGDTAGDIKILEMVENPIAFNPEMSLYAHAVQKGWKIVLERKNMVYELGNINGKYQLAKTNV